MLFQRMVRDLEESQIDIFGSSPYAMIHLEINKMGTSENGLAQILKQYFLSLI